MLILKLASPHKMSRKLISMTVLKLRQMLENFKTKTLQLKVTNSLISRARLILTKV